MTRLPRSNKNLALRLLLLCGYCFFFASQFNHEYYYIANNFVYKSTGANCNNKKDAAHLSIDKRFSCPSPFQKTSPPALPQPPSYIGITHTTRPQPAPYTTPNLPINSFRGPPAA